MPKRGLPTAKEVAGGFRQRRQRRRAERRSGGRCGRPRRRRCDDHRVLAKKESTPRRAPRRRQRSIAWILGGGWLRSSAPVGRTGAGFEQPRAGESGRRRSSSTSRRGTAGRTAASARRRRAARGLDRRRRGAAPRPRCDARTSWTKASVRLARTLPHDDDESSHLPVARTARLPPEG